MEDDDDDDDDDYIGFAVLPRVRHSGYQLELKLVLSFPIGVRILHCGIAVSSPDGAYYPCPTLKESYTAANARLVNKRRRS